MIIEINTRSDFEENARAIRAAASSHEVIAFPTDTVNGIGCSPYDEIAIQKLLKIKRRDSAKGFPVLVSSIEAAGRIAEMDDDAGRLAKKFWPGALTLLLPLRDKRISETVACKGRIAVRMPNHKIAIMVADAFDGCIIGTSSNISGTKPIKSAEKIKQELNGIELIIKSRIKQHGMSSTLFDASNRKVIREGPISKEMIFSALHSEKAITRRFSRNKEDFVCGHCGGRVKGNGYTNHCPRCLWSRHVDINPGDRASNCMGMMKPIRAEYLHGNYTIVYRCQKCGIVKKNKESESDDRELLVELAKS